MAVYLSLALACFLFAQNASVFGAEYYDLFNTGQKEWRMVFKGLTYVRSEVYLAYLNGAGVPQNVEPGCKEPVSSSPCYHHYRNGEVLDHWGNIAEVAFVIYDNSIAVKHIIFDGTNSDYLNWFQQSKIKNSTWTNLKTHKPMNFFGIKGDDVIKRHFFINQQYGGCPKDCGWFVAIDQNPGPCAWEQEDGFPVFKYSKTDDCVNWTTGDFGRAESIAIFIKYNTNGVVG